MTVTHAATVFGALSRAFAPPEGDASAFVDLDLFEPDAASLASEHVALFGRAGVAVVSPYEGVADGGGIHALLDAYARGGLAPDPSFRDRPDHVSAVLAFLERQALDSEEARARDDSVEADRAADRARSFFVAHVQTWVPEFLTTLSRAEEFPIHRLLAERAGVLLRREAACLGVPPAPLHRGEPAPVAACCAACRRPLGFALPDPDPSRPVPGPVCLSCRLTAASRRSHR